MKDAPASTPIFKLYTYSRDSVKSDVSARLIFLKQFVCIHDVQIPLSLCLQLCIYFSKFLG